MIRTIARSLAVCGALALGWSAQEGVSQTHSDVGQGLYAFYEGNYHQAIEWFNRAVARGSSDPRTFYFRGLAYGRLGDPQQAEADFQYGAALEARGFGHSVSRALERIQGGERLQLERFRRGRLLAQRSTPPPPPAEGRGAVPDFPPSESPVPAAGQGRVVRPSPDASGPRASASGSAAAPAPFPAGEGGEPAEQEPAAGALDDPFGLGATDAPGAAEAATPRGDVDVGSVIGSVLRAVGGAAMPDVDLENFAPPLPGGAPFPPGGPPAGAFPGPPGAGAPSSQAGPPPFGPPPGAQGPAAGDDDPFFPAAPPGAPAGPPATNPLGNPAGGGSMQPQGPSGGSPFGPEPQEPAGSPFAPQPQPEGPGGSPLGPQGPSGPLGPGPQSGAPGESGAPLPAEADPGEAPVPDPFEGI